ncbi:MAG: RDD family protein [Ktedonobacteraceae bacterium]
MFRPGNSPQPYAGSICRMGAYLIDIGFLYVAVLGSQLGLRTISKKFFLTRLKTGPQIERWVFLTVSLPTWFYFTLSERSKRQGTIGKQLLGLQVTDMAGQRISFGRALLRTMVKLAPWEITHLSLMLPTPIFQEDSPKFRPGLIVANLLLITYIALVVVTPRKQSLHDLLARTIVLERNGGPTKFLQKLLKARHMFVSPLLLPLKKHYHNIAVQLFRQEASDYDTLQV